jgi:hypothetical protein
VIRARSIARKYDRVGEVAGAGHTSVTDLKRPLLSVLLDARRAQTGEAVLID